MDSIPQMLFDLLTSLRHPKYCQELGSKPEGPLSSSPFPVQGWKFWTLFIDGFLRPCFCILHSRPLHVFMWLPVFRKLAVGWRRKDDWGRAATNRKKHPLSTPMTASASFDGWLAKPYLPSLGRLQKGQQSIGWMAAPLTAMCRAQWPCGAEESQISQSGVIGWRKEAMLPPPTAHARFTVPWHTASISSHQDS
jgi:hypothetical protein